MTKRNFRPAQTTSKYSRADGANVVMPKKEIGKRRGNGGPNLGKKFIARETARLESRPGHGYVAPEKCDFPTKIEFFKMTRPNGTQYTLRIATERCGAKALVTVTVDGNIAHRCAKHGHKDLPT